MYCKHCGAQIREGADICVVCGEWVERVPEPEKLSPTKFVVWGFIFALISLGVLPPVFGGLGIYFGVKTRRMGKETLGTILMIVCIICMIVGMYLSYMFYTGRL